MKLLILTQSVGRDNPICGFFLDWIREFSKRYEAVIVVCLEAGKYDLPDNVKVLSLGKEIISQKSIRSKVKSRALYIYNFYKYIWQNRNDYDSVFVHMNPEYAVLGGLFWKSWRKKIGLWYMHKSVPWYLRVAEKLVDVIFTGTKESFRLKSNKVKITGHGIDLNRFRAETSSNKIKSDLFRIITIGRISPVKDYETMIKAAEILKNNGVKFVIDVLGGPGTPKQADYFKKIKKLTKEKNLNDVIVYHGPIPNDEIVKYLQNSDLFVHMSQTGSLDKSILEAMACGVIPVSSNDASKKMFAYDKRLLYEDGDAVGLSDKIREIIQARDKKEIKNKIVDMVKNNHGLNNLIKKIAVEL